MGGSGNQDTVVQTSSLIVWRDDEDNSDPGEFSLVKTKKPSRKKSINKSPSGGLRSRPLRSGSKTTQTLNSQRPVREVRSKYNFRYK
uniref:Uncharacterized protein n=1 Tax=Arundo donax TaxID=35708 RepID=A0A0A8YE02_ARUDO